MAFQISCKLTTSENPGNEGVFFCTAVNFHLKKIDFNFSGYNVPTSVCPTFLLKIVGWFDATVKMMVPGLNHELKLDNSKVYVRLLYRQPRDMDTHAR